MVCSWYREHSWKSCHQSQCLCSCADTVIAIRVIKTAINWKKLYFFILVFDRDHVLLIGCLLNLISHNLSNRVEDLSIGQISRMRKIHSGGLKAKGKKDSKLPSFVFFSMKCLRGKMFFEKWCKPILWTLELLGLLVNDLCVLCSCFFPANLIACIVWLGLFPLLDRCLWQIKVAPYCWTKGISSEEEKYFTSRTTLIFRFTH